jgi:hypothetical protein
MHKILRASTLFFAFLAGSVFAQAQIDVPFEFKVGEAQMPAGRYTLRPVTPAATGPYYLRDRATGKTVMMSTPVPLADPELRARRLVFDCESGCQLAEVWATPGFGGSRRRPARQPVSIAAR